MVDPAVAEATGALSDGLVEAALEGSLQCHHQPLGLAGPAVDLRAGLAQLMVMESLLS